MTNPEKFQSRSALFTGWVLITFFIGFTMQSVFYGSATDTFITVLVSASAAFGIFLCFLKPHVIIFDEGIKIVNPTKEIIASWDRVDEIETKYSMAIFVDGRAFYAWAAPAPSRRHSRGLHKSDLLPGANAPRRFGDSPRSDSGVCAHIARLRRKDFVVKDIPALNIFEIRRKIFTRDLNH